MEPLPESAHTGWPFPFMPQDWEHTPAAVQAYVHTLQDELTQLRERVEALEARLTQNSTTSHRPPSSDSPYKKPRQRTTTATPRKAGGQTGPSGPSPGALATDDGPGTATRACACGNTTFALTTPYHTHQVLELPPIAMEVTHWVLHQGWCPDCGRWSKAQVPAEHATGLWTTVQCLDGRTGREPMATGGGSCRPFVPRSCRCPSAWGPSRRCSTGSTQAIEPHYSAIATQARHAPVNYIDETPWFLTNTLQWLWVMASDTVAFYMIHPHRSKEAFAALIDDWAGLLVSDGYGVYRHWVQARQTCLAHLIRTARGLAERQQHRAWRPVGHGRWRSCNGLCHMATAPPTGGEWRAWYARLCKWIDQYHDRADDAGRFARRLLREMDSLWVFLAQHGVEPTNNRAERALRFGVLWRKRSLGTASAKGNRWVERILSLRETCRSRRGLLTLCWWRP